MGKIDTSGWKEFRVGELFEKLNLRFLPNRVFDKASDISEVKSEEFNLPLVNAKHSNNGIMYYGRKHEWEYEVLTIDIVADGAASTGDVYAQPQETGVLYNAYLVKPKAKCVTGLILFFLSTVIQRCVKDHFGYDNKCTWDKVKHETILLPVDKTGQPDWAYMESYMANLEAKVAESLTMLQAAKDAEKKKVDTREWGEFQVGELFDIKHPAARSEKKYCEGEINYVSSGAFNNGVANKLMPLPNELLDRGGCITVSPLDGSSFYQEEDFLGRGGSGASISILYNSHLNRNNALFICSVIRSSANGFGYTDLLNGENLKSLTIKLPVDKTGQPDWEYMEEYMRKVEERVKKTINTFCVIRKIKYDC